jgi:hypothetical protein
MSEDWQKLGWYLSASHHTAEGRDRSLGVLQILNSIVAGSPCPGSVTPVGAGVFRFSPAGIVVTESGIPAVMPTTRARIYVDKSGGHDTGLAIAVPDSTALNVTVKAFQNDGTTAAGNGPGQVLLTANGHRAAFVGQLITGLPAGFTGVLDISAPNPFVALTLRSLTNARGDFLLTTFPIAEMNQPVAAPVVFPQIADGGGYTTEFILLSSAGVSSVTLSFFGDTGAPLAIGR